MYLKKKKVNKTNFYLESNWKPLLLSWFGGEGQKQELNKNYYGSRPSWNITDRHNKIVFVSAKIKLKICAKL